MVVGQGRLSSLGGMGAAGEPRAAPRLAAQRLHRSHREIVRAGRSVM